MADPSRKRRVLVTNAETRIALAVTRSLGDAFDVVVASPRPLAVAASSRFARRHLRYRTDQSFPNWLINTIEREAIHVVICPHETTLILANQRRHALMQLPTILTFPGPEVLDPVLDKAKTLALAREVGLQVPRTVVLSQRVGAQKAAAGLRYPLIVKSRHSHYWEGSSFAFGNGTRYARSPRELQQAISALDSRLPAPLLQEYIEGYGMGIFVLLDRTGKLCASFAHRRLRDVRPSGSGSVLRQSVIADPTLLNGCLRLLRQMNWWGPAMVEFRKDERSGEAVLMEVNGRFWGSLQLAVDSGVDFPRLLIEVACGGSPDPPPYKEGVVLRWWLGDLMRSLRVLRGRPPGFPGRFPSRWSACRELLGPQPASTRNELFRRDDPWPVITELLAAAGSLPSRL